MLGTIYGHVMVPPFLMVAKAKQAKNAFTSVPGWTTASYVEKTTKKGNISLKNIYYDNYGINDQI